MHEIDRDHTSTRQHCEHTPCRTISLMAWPCATCDCGAMWSSSPVVSETYEYNEHHQHEALSLQRLTFE